MIQSLKKQTKLGLKTIKLKKVKKAYKKIRGKYSKKGQILVKLK